MSGLFGDWAAQLRARRRAMEAQERAQFEAHKRFVEGQMAIDPSTVRVEAGQGLVIEGKIIRKGLAA